MFVALLAAATQIVAPPAPPAPPTLSFPPPITISPSPVPTITPYPPSLRSNEPPLLVGLRVTSGGAVLFADQLRVDSLLGANYAENRTEALAMHCPGAERYDRQQLTSFTIRLNSRPSQAGRRLLSVNVTWTRPIDGADCLTSGSRGATLNQTILVEPGKSAVLTGDGGLRVELTPR